MTSSVYYTPSGAPGAKSSVNSAPMQAEFELIAAGFALLPPSLTANKAVVVNAGGSALTVTVGSLALAGNFTTTGAFSTTFTASANVTLALPGVNGTLALLNAPAFTGGITVDGASTITGDLTVTANLAVGDTLSVTGNAYAAAFNKVAITEPATGSTLTIADGKTLTVSNTITLAGTDGTTVTGPPTSGKLGWFLYAEQDVSGVTTVDFLAIPSTIKHLQWIMEGMVDTDGTTVGLQVYVAGTLKSGGTDYFTLYSSNLSSASTPATTTSTSSSIQLSNGTNNGTYGFSADGLMHNIQNASTRKKCKFSSEYLTTGGAVVADNDAVGNYQTAGAINGLRFLTGGGTFTGKISLLATY